MSEKTKTDEKTKKNHNSNNNGFNEVKIFQARESLLTELITSNEHVRSAKNMLTAFLLLFLTATFGHYLLDANELLKDIEFIKWSLIDFDRALLIWITMNLSIFILHYIFKIIENVRIIFTLVYIIYMIAFLILPVYALWKYCVDYCPYIFAALVGEQSRLIMKIHSFVQEVYYKKNTNNKDNEKNATVYHLLYFLFVPTLLYRHSYPRTKQINWIKFLSYTLQFHGCLFLLFAVVRRYVQYNFSTFGSHALTVKSIVYIFCIGGVVGISFMFLMFYGLLHCWMNIWAELLRFADRKFYDVWWTSHHYGQFYRYWNIVVHDWLYAYVYVPVNKATGSRDLGALTTFLVSAVFHEYILIGTFGFFYPLLFVQFAILGVALYFAGRFYRGYHTLGNMIMFGSLFIGWSMLITLYSIEWYARKNCPPVFPNNKLLDYMYPRTFNCVKLAF